jgi:hypothetical protein
MEEQEKTTKKKKENFNPLKKETVEVKFIRSTSKMYSNESPLSGGLAETASITYTVPRENGMIKQILTPDEITFFENYFGLPEGAMNFNAITNNYWTTYNRGYINRVALDKSGKRLDLSNAKDYIEYKILLANTEYICPNQETLENFRKATYRFVLNNDNTVAMSAGKSADLKFELFEIYGKYKEDADMLRVICYLIEHKKVSPKTKIELLKSKVVSMMENRAKDCYAVMSSKNLEQKKAILIGVEKGIISDRNGFYYYTENGQKLSNEYEEPNLNNAANYLADVANQELYFSISKKIK